MTTDTSLPLPATESLERYEADSRAVRLGYRKIPPNRDYAMDSVATRQLIALWRAAWRTIDAAFTDSAFVELLQRIVPFVPSLTQSWRPGDELTPPALPSDAVTNMVMSNPFSTDDEVSLKSRQLLQERNPELARYLERLSRDGGYSATFHYELEDAKARRGLLRKFVYGAKEYASNPFLVSEPNRTELGEWLQKHDALTAEIYRWESQPVRLPWGVDSVNLTQQGEIFDSLRSNPTKAGISANVVLAASAIDKTLRDALIAEAEAAKNAAAAREAALRK